MTTAAPEPAVWTVPEVAKILRVSERLVYELIAQGELPHKRVGVRRILIPKIALQRYLEEA